MSPQEMGEKIFRQNDAGTLIDDMAQPFLDLAEKFEIARLNELDDKDWYAILESNMFVWRFVANYLPRQLRDDVPEEMGALLVRISEFMMQAGSELRSNRDDTLIQRVIELNLNMCNQILALHDQMRENAA
ncbi:MAG: hypothetical protein RIM72_17585 [Alphaproteobacteria bacterium]